jgi:glycosyltransferase involved in cell wall biosynthesis
MQIAHLFTIPDSAQLIRAEINFMLERGHRIAVLAGKVDSKSFDPIDGVEYIVLPSLTRRMDLRSDFRAIRELWSALRRMRPDVLHTHMPKTGWIGRVVGRLSGTPYVVNTCHGLYARLGSTRFQRTSLIALESVSELFAHENLFQNTDDCELMARVLLWKSHRFIGNGVDSERFKTQSDQRKEARSRFGFSNEEIVVGGVGRLIAHKGIDRFESLAEQFSHMARFVWAGPEEPDKSRQTTFVSQAVDWLGHLKDMSAFYAAIDIFVLPSMFEGVPRSAMEAGAAGLPVVLLDVPGSRDLQHGERGALLADPTDPDSLAMIVSSLIQDAMLRRRRGKSMAEVVAHFHNQLKIAETLEEIYTNRRSSMRFMREQNKKTSLK